MKQFGKTSALLLVTLLICSVASAKDPMKQKRPRFAAPTEYGNGYVNTVEYLMINDPREAAKALLSESAVAQVDIDKPGASEPHEEVLLPSGSFVPSRDDEAFLRLVDARVASGRAEEDTTCLVKMKRVPSIRELAEIMSSGVRVYRGIQFYTYISRVPFKAARSLRNNPLVEWIGFCDPESKISAGTTFVNDLPVTAHSLVQDNRRLRTDLAHVGAKVVRYRESIGNGETDFEYTITIAPSEIAKLTSLWWVYLVYQNQSVFHEGALNLRALGVTRNDLHPTRSASSLFSQ